MKGFLDTTEGLRTAGRWMQSFVSRRSTVQAIAVLLFVAFSAFTVDWRPAVPALSPGDISPEDFTAPRTVVITDEALTARLREEAVRKTPEVFDADFAAAARAESRLRAFLADLEQWAEADALRRAMPAPGVTQPGDAPAGSAQTGGSPAEGAPKGGAQPGAGQADTLPGAEPGRVSGGSGSAADPGNGSGTDPGPGAPTGGTPVSTPGTGGALPQPLPPMPPLPEGVSEETARAIAAAGLLTRETRDFVAGLLLRVMAEDIRPDDLAASRQQMERLVSRELKGGELLAPLVAQFVELTLLPNPEETAARRAAAEAAVQPVQETIKQGQIIARRGSVLTAEQIYRLQVLGLLEPPAENRAIQMALSGLLALIFAVIWLSQTADRSLREQCSGLVLAWTGVGALVLMARFDIPLPVGALLILAAAIWGRHLTRITGLFLLGIALIADGGAPLPMPAAVLLGAAFVVPLWVHPYRLSRISMLGTGAVLGGLAAVALLLDLPVTNPPQSAVRVLAHGLSGVLALGLMPVWEWLTGCTSTLRLQELSQMSHPLLRRLFVEAPGTWQHSLAVGHLAEMAAQAVGANPILARVAGYYHDVGKLRAASGLSEIPSACYFTENQLTMLGAGTPNPHDALSPRQSAAIIRRHVDEGVQMLREARFPEAVIEIARTHHGTSRVEYFYRKAQAQAQAQAEAAAQTEAQTGERAQATAGTRSDGQTAPEAEAEPRMPDPVREEDYRYRGPAPVSREAAIVMIVDTVEAFSRSCGGLTQSEIHARILQLIQDKIADRQLDSCLLTMRDVAIIAEVLALAIKGAVHERVAYPPRDTAAGARGR